MAMWVTRTIELSEDRFSKDRGHPKEGRNPHPEDGPRATHGNGGSNPSEVTRPYLGSNGRGERLEGRHPVLVGLFTKEADATKDLFHRLGKAANLNEAKLPREVNPRSD